MSRNIRTNFLTDKSTFGNSTMPIGAIVPIFKATDDKVTDNGVVNVNGLGQVVSGAGGGTGYVTDLGTIAGYPTTPIDFNIPAGTAFEVGTDNVNIIMNDAWVSFQNKHEFNPAHRHPGLISFVIWIDIPFFT